MKQKFANYSGKVLACMDAIEIYKQAKEASALASSQSIHNNGGIAKITGIGPSSLVCNTSLTKPSRVASYTLRSRSM